MAQRYDPIKGTFYDPGQTKTGQIIVKTASQLAGTLLSDKVYFIDVRIDMEGQSIEVPAGGLTFEGHGYDISALYDSTASHTLFTSPVGGSGNLNVRGLNMYCTGASSKVFDMVSATGNEAVELNTVNIGEFPVTPGVIGELDGFRQFRCSDVAIIKPGGPLTFTGAWAGGFSIRDTILLNIGAVTVFDGTAVFAGSSISDLNANWIDDAAIVYDFDATNFSLDQGFALNGARFSITATGPVPNMPEASTRRYFKNCTGVKDTFPGGSWDVTSSAVTALTVSTPAKVAGTTTYSDLVHFSQTTNNAFVYDSTIEKQFRVSGYIIVDGGPNDEIAIIIRRYDASAAAYVDEAEYIRNIANVLGALDVATFSPQCNVLMAEGDRIELWIENRSDGTDATVTGQLHVDLRV